MAKQKLNFKKIDKISNTDILNDKSPKIRELSINVTFPLKKEDKKLMLQMIEVVRISQDDPVTAESRNIQYSNGISAIQLGHNKKMIYVRIPGEFGADIEEFALVNPRIEWNSNESSYLESGETSLSTPDKVGGVVVRSEKIRLIGHDFFTEREVEVEALGATSIAIQQQMDHLLGILYFDRINGTNPFHIQQNLVKIK